ncbi:hypothetical protein [Herbiconiux daphne]|uniref:Uncharacterized protein n=1 Tax=Herbiconiux daphne TaxID=2970914 RepID=A0ABT2H3M7_9MICO|nr:hypothetical protein [Herbiconiux daphne]MCS5734541.1 hypothetical protein [Herbiconiux daphne]
MSDQATKTDLELYAETVATLREVAARLAADGLAAEVRPEDVAEPLYVAARLFSAQTDKLGRGAQWPLEENALNATDTVVLVTALLEAADVNLFDMAIWYRRAQ